MSCMKEIKNITNPSTSVKNATWNRKDVYCAHDDKNGDGQGIKTISPAKYAVIFERPDFHIFPVCHDFDMIEKQLFNQFKRDLYELSSVQSKFLTPFEKNIEVWREMWRVIEKSDLIFQIVDSRNPSFFYSAELTHSVKDKYPEKECHLIMNKADFLNENQARIHREFFQSRNIKIHFYSTIPSKVTINSCLNTSQLISIMENCSVSQTPLVHVGFIGFPNVGKSSIINDLLGSHKTAISSTPGKTKHLQTHHLKESIVLCDSPGLVLPKFVDRKHDLILNGVIPIDHSNDLIPAIESLVKIIPKKYFQECYGLNIPSNNDDDYCNYEELLSALSIFRRYLGPKGVPDMSKSAKVILKDLFNGKLKICYPPSPEYDFFKFNSFEREFSEIKTNEHLQELIISFNDVKLSNKKILENDSIVYQVHDPTVVVSSSSEGSETEEIEVSLHKLRRGPKNLKREKLRRQFAHLNVY
ncbi:Large subunit GTPase 1 [Thelohanellus kitauei]|uniref:Large subunit GTPase 1 homolog n=1 Tax=Thelohanellus kitauei TaxID=669202 RepID=A0A0C2MS14_THEKT|nr:Large subunit GTPase 1 [Thelohanellus kitauei]